MDVNALIATAEREPPAPPVAELTLPPEFQGFEDSEDPLVKGPWRPENERDADWALKRLAEIRAEIASIHAQAEATIARVRAREAELVAKLERGDSFFSWRLTEFAERFKSKLLTGKKRSRDFIHGRIAWRRKAAKLVVSDPGALEAWLLTQPVEAGLYRMKVHPEMKVLNEWARDRNLVPPGTDLEMESETLTIDAFTPERALGE